jgi:hypothetical protein
MRFRIFLVYGYHQSVQKQNCLIMFFIMVMEAKISAGRIGRDVNKKAHQIVHAMFIWRSRQRHYLSVSI